MNNLKSIRELYGATQEDVATAIGVNRVTVVNWENNNSIASSGNQEKLSLYYGIEPKYFYDAELDDVARKAVADTANRARELDGKSSTGLGKEKEFHDLFSNLNFLQAIQYYTVAIKIVLASIDKATIEEIQNVELLTAKMDKRLRAFIDLRTEEANSDGPTLWDMLESLDK